VLNHRSDLKKTTFNFVRKGTVLLATYFKLTPLPETAHHRPRTLVPGKFFISAKSSKTRELLCQQWRTELCVLSRLLPCCETCGFVYGPRPNGKLLTRLYISQQCYVLHVKLANFFPLMDKLDKLSGIVSELVKDFWERLQKKTPHSCHVDQFFRTKRRLQENKNWPCIYCVFTVAFIIVSKRPSRLKSSSLLLLLRNKKFIFPDTLTRLVMLACQTLGHFACVSFLKGAPCSGVE